MSKKIMLIGIGWEQLPLAASAKKLGLMVVATTSWDGEILADRVYRGVDSRDLDRLERIFLEERPDAVLADECDYSMYAVAYLTEKYQLPGPSLDVLTITNNKFLQRQCGSECGILQPEYQLCWSIEQAKQFAAARGYPIVLKPIDNRGSIGVGIVTSEEQLSMAWYEAVKNAHSRMVIAEQFIEGGTVIVDGLCDGSAFHMLAAATKDNYQGTTTVAKKLYYPGRLTQEQYRTLERYSAQIVAQIGANFGFVHIEYIYDAKAEDFWFLEIANRGGGVFISNMILPYLVQEDLTLSYIRQSLGDRSPLLTHASDHKALMYFLEPSGDEDLAKLIEAQKDGLLAAHISKNVCQVHGNVKDASNRIGVIILKGRSFEEMERRAEALERRASAFQKEEHTFCGG